MISHQEQRPKRRSVPRISDSIQEESSIKESIEESKNQNDEDDGIEEDIIADGASESKEGSDDMIRESLHPAEESFKPSKIQAK